MCSWCGVSQQWCGFVLLEYRWLILIYVWILDRQIQAWKAGKIPNKEKLICRLHINTGVGCHFLLQGFVPTQGSNLHLLHLQADSFPLSHMGSPQWCWHSLNFVYFRKDEHLRRLIFLGFVLQNNLPKVQWKGIQGNIHPQKWEKCVQRHRGKENVEHVWSWSSSVYRSRACVLDCST